MGKTSGQWIVVCSIKEARVARRWGSRRTVVRRPDRGPSWVGIGVVVVIIGIGVVIYLLVR